MSIWTWNGSQQLTEQSFGSSLCFRGRGHRSPGPPWVSEWCGRIFLVCLFLNGHPSVKDVGSMSQTQHTSSSGTLLVLTAALTSPGSLVEMQNLLFNKILGGICVPWSFRSTVYYNLRFIALTHSLPTYFIALTQSLPSYFFVYKLEQKVYFSGSWAKNLTDYWVGKNPSERENISWV